MLILKAIFNHYQLIGYKNFDDFSMKFSIAKLLYNAWWFLLNYYINLYDTRNKDSLFQIISTENNEQLSCHLPNTVLNKVSNWYHKSQNDDENFMNFQNSY